jgi:hypothetical protein
VVVRCCWLEWLLLLLLDGHNYDFLIARIWFGLWLISPGYART